MPQQNWKEELEEYKCTGYTCRHETSEDHYLIDKDFIEQTLAQQRKEIVEEIRQIPDKNTEPLSKEERELFLKIEKEELNTLPQVETDVHRFNDGYNKAKADIITKLSRPEL